MARKALPGAGHSPVMDFNTHQKPSSIAAGIALTRFFRRPSNSPGTHRRK
jgi:hypothetical protein